MKLNTDVCRTDRSVIFFVPIHQNSGIPST